MRAFDQLIASNQADALAQMAQEPSVARRLASVFKNISSASWAHMAQWGVAGLMATGTLFGPVAAHADEYQPVYQTAQVPTAAASTDSNATYQPVYQQAPQAATGGGANVGTAIKTVVGAGIGGVLGHFIGGGKGNALATGLGAAAGGTIGYASGSNERPVYQSASYSPNNPNPYPQQTPAPAGGNASGANMGTFVGGAAGALIGSRFGHGSGNIASALVGAAAGAVLGTTLENASINNHTPNYQRVLQAQDESGACFAQWSGRLQPVRSLSENPQADGAMHQSVAKLGEAYNEYLEEASRYRQDRQNAQWAVTATEATQQRNLLSQETQQMVNAEKKYVYYRGTFMEKCNLAAEQGYNVRDYNQVKQLLTLDTGGYTYKNPNPTVTATYGTPRRPGF